MFSNINVLVHVPITGKTSASLFIRDWYARTQELLFFEYLNQPIEQPIPSRACMTVVGWCQSILSHSIYMYMHAAAVWTSVKNRYNRYKLLSEILRILVRQNILYFKHLIQLKVGCKGNKMKAHTDYQPRRKATPELRLLYWSSQTYASSIF